MVRLLSLNTGRIRRILSLSLLLFSSIGFNIFQVSGRSGIWMLILLGLNVSILNRVKLKDLLVLSVFIGVTGVIFLLKNLPQPIFLFTHIISAYAVLLNYVDRPILLKKDLSQLLNVYMYYALMHVLFLFVNKSILQPSHFGRTIEHFMYLFWFVRDGGPAITHHYRMIGLCWEPGLWQMLMNLNLIFALYEKRSKLQIVLATLSVLLCFSTTGMLIMIFVFVYHFIVFMKGNLMYLFYMAIVSLCLFAFVSDNINQKISGEGYGSFAARYSDFFVGYEILKENPWFGKDPHEVKNLYKVMQLREELYYENNPNNSKVSNSFLTTNIVSGFVITLLDYGIVIGCVLFVLLFKHRIFSDSRLSLCMISIFFMTFLSEPISRTSLFYFLIIFPILIDRKKLGVKK